MNRIRPAEGSDSREPPLPRPFPEFGDQKMLSTIWSREHGSHRNGRWTGRRESTPSRWPGIPRRGCGWWFPNAPSSSPCFLKILEIGGLVSLLFSLWSHCLSSRLSLWCLCLGRLLSLVCLAPATSPSSRGLAARSHGPDEHVLVQEYAHPCTHTPTGFLRTPQRDLRTFPF